MYTFPHLSKRLVQLVMEEEDDEGTGGGGTDSALNQLIEVKKQINEVNRQLCKLKKLASISRMAKSTSLKSKQQFSSEPSASDELLKSRKPSDPIIEGVSSSNGEAGEVKGQGDLNFSVPAGKANGHLTAPLPGVAAKSEGTLNSVGSENTNNQVKTGDTLESTEIVVHETAAEVDPLFEEGIPDALEAGEGEDNVFIDEDDEQPITPVQEAAPGTCIIATTEWRSGNDDREEEAPIVLPPSSKSYSSVASSPPTTSSLNRQAPPTHQRQQQLQLQSSQQLCSPRYSRASSLPPSSSSNKPDTSNTTQNSTHSQELQQHQRPPSPAVYSSSTRPQGSKFIPIPSSSSVSGAGGVEQEWPTLHDSQQQPRRIRTHNAAMVSSNQNASPSSPLTGSASSFSAPKMPGVTSKIPPTPVLGSPPLSSMRSSSISGTNFSNPLLPAHTTAAQSNLPPRFAKMQQAAAISSQSTVSVQGTTKRRPAGIGRGGRPLPPLDNSLFGGGGVVGICRGGPPVRPVLLPYMVQAGPPVMGGMAPPAPHIRGRPLLPSPLRPSVGIMPPPVTTPIPVSPEERWIYMNRRGRPRSKYDYPPLGSSAGLDII